MQNKSLQNVIVFVFLFIAGILGAQSSFIERIPHETILEGSVHRTSLMRVEQERTTLTATPIRMNSIWDYQIMGELEFRIPGVEKPVHIVADMPMRYSETDYAWIGDVLNEENLATGYAIFIQKGKKRYGRIELEDRSFVIEDLNLPDGDDQVLIEIDRDAAGNGCGADQLSPPGDTPGNGTVVEGPPPPSGEPCEAVLSILVLYTQEVLDADKDPEQLATCGIMALNKALADSYIPNIEVQADLVGVELLENFTEIENASLALQRLKENPNVSSLRDQYNADLVVLLQTANLYASNSISQDPYAVVGFANINERMEIDNVYSVIEATASAEIFAHEVGHLLGCRHLREQETLTHAYAHAYKICTMTGMPIPGEENCLAYKSTVMDGGRYSRILRFSSKDADATYMEQATGDAVNDNARMIARTACTIGLFGGMVEGDYDDQPFSAFASGPTNVYHNNTDVFEYSSYYWGCTHGGIVTYRWEISWDYGNTFQHLSLEEDAVLRAINVPTHAPVGFIRLTANCSEEPDMYVDFLEIKNWTASNLATNPVTGGHQNDAMVERSDISGTDLQSLSESTFRVFPNPVRDQLQIQLGETEGHEINVSLVSMHGVSHQLYDGEGYLLPASLDVNFVPPGYYVLSVVSSDMNLFKPIIISR